MSNSHAEDTAHSGPIKNPKQLLWTVAAAFIIPIFIIIGLVLFVTTAFKPAGSNQVAAMGLGGVTEQARERTQAARLQKVGMVEIRDANRPLKGGEDVFKAQCSACHMAGLAGAPKVGDTQAWAPRIAQGYEVLLTSALKGKGAMGPQGGGEFSDLEIGRAVVYMANASGGSLPDPKAAGAAGTQAAGTQAVETQVAGAQGVGAQAAATAEPATPQAAGTQAAGAHATAGGAVQAAQAVAAARVEQAKENVAAATQPPVAADAATTPAATTLAATTPAAASSPPAPSPSAAPAAAERVAAVAPVPGTGANAAAAPAVATAASSAAGEALYKSACFACHVAGVAGAPKFGDKQAWAPRIAAGLDTLTASVLKGKGAMPPRGGSSASDADIHSAVEYMVNAAR